MKNLRQSKKALSPVIASIILIAVTVAVSIAVAAWMGALVVNQMHTEELKITSVGFTDTDVVISVSNQGTTGVTISDVFINGQSYTAAAYDPAQTIAANGRATITVSLGTTLGNSYEVKLSTAQGNVFMYTAVAT